MLVCRNVDEFSMEYKRSNITNDLIYKLIQKVNILTEDRIMEVFNILSIYQTRLCTKKHLGTYIKVVLERHGLNDISKK